MTPTDGFEEKTAAVLNGAMIIALSTLLAGFAAWIAADYLWRAVAQDTSIWRSDAISGLLIPLSLFVGGVRGARFGLRMVRSRSLRQ